MSLGFEGIDEDEVIVEESVGRVVAELVVLQEPADVELVLSDSFCCLLSAPVASANPVGIKDRGAALPFVPELDGLGDLFLKERFIVIAEGADFHSPAVYLEFFFLQYRFYGLVEPPVERCRVVVEGILHVLQETMLHER